MAALMAIYLSVNGVNEWRGKLPKSNQESQGINPFLQVSEALEFAAELVDTGTIEFTSSALIASVYLYCGHNYHGIRRWMENYVIQITGENRFMEDKMTKDERVMVLCMAAALAEGDGV